MKITVSILFGFLLSTCLTSVGKAGSTAYRSLVLSDNPIVYYEFDETSGIVAHNSAPTGALYDGSVNTVGGSVSVNQSSFSQGKTAFDFGGGFVGAASGLTNSLDEWTLEAWVNYDSAKISASNFLSNDQGGWNNDVLFGIGPETGTVGVPGGHVGVIQQGNPGATRDAAGAPLAANEWHHVVVTGSTMGGALTVYIDGVVVASDTSVINGMTFNGMDGFGMANLTIGAARPNAGDAGYRPYDGLLDEVAIYPRVLDATTIAGHFNAGGTATDFGLTVTNYAPGQDPIQFQWPTHIAFGPGQEEIITDLKNNRLVYRNTPGEAFAVSPLPLSGPHSVAYNPGDGLYYVNDTENHRLVAFSDLSSGTIVAETNVVAGITLSRPHDVVIDPDTGWIYALNPNSGHVFRFTAIGVNEQAILAPVGGYARALTIANGKLYAIGSAKGRIVEIVDWDTPSFNIYDSFDPSGSDGAAGSWTRTGLVLNDVDYFEGAWYATSYFTESYAAGTDFNENKFIRFQTFNDFVAGNWVDLSSLVPSGMTPYYLTVNADTLNLAIFNHESPGTGDRILQFALATFSIPHIVYDAVNRTTTLTWESKEGEVFDVYKRTRLSPVGGDSWVLIQSSLPAAGSPAEVTTYVVDNEVDDQQSFYRVARTSDGN